MSRTALFAGGVILLFLLQASCGTHFELKENGRFTILPEPSAGFAPVKISSSYSPGFSGFVAGAFDTGDFKLHINGEHQPRYSVSDTLLRDFIVGYQSVVYLDLSPEGNGKPKILIDNDSRYEFSFNLTDVKKTVANNARAVGEYKGTLYFFAHNAIGNNDAILSVDWDNLEKKAKTGSVNAKIAFNLTTSTTDVKYAYNSFVVKSGNEIQLVDPRCLTESSDFADSCVIKYSSSDSNTSMYIFSDTVVIPDSDVNNQHIKYRVERESLIQQSDYLVKRCCTADPLRSYLYCAADDLHIVSRHPITSLSTEERLDRLLPEVSDSPSSSIAVEYDLSEERGMICIQTDAGDSSKAHCYSVTVSNCSAEKDFMSDTVFCRLNLETYTVVKLANCTDKSKCINSLINFDISPKKLDANSKRKVVLSSNASLSMSDKSSVKCIFFDSKNKKYTGDKPTVSDAGDKATCELTDDMGAGEYSVYLTYAVGSNNFQFSQPAYFTVISCSDIKTCSYCAAEAETGCNWNYRSMSCQYGTSCDKQNCLLINNATECPRIDAFFPSTIFFNEETEISLATRNIHKGDDLKCVFRNSTLGDGQNVEREAEAEVSDDESTVLCKYTGDGSITPKAPIIDLNISVYFKDNPKKPIASAPGLIEARKCEGYTSCDSCSSRSECTWVIDTSDAYKAGCTQKDNKQLKCPSLEVVDEYTKLICDANRGETNVTVAFKGSDLPSEVYCSIDDNKFERASVNTTDGGVTIYSCMIPPPTDRSKTVLFILEVPSIHPGAGNVEFYRNDAVYYLKCPSLLDDVVDPNVCLRDHDKCGIVYFPNSSKPICTYEEDKDNIGDGIWTRVVLQEFDLNNVMLNMDEDKLELINGFCHDKLMNGKYKCVVTDEDDYTTFHTVPLVCISDDTASCSWSSRSANISSNGFTGKTHVHVTNASSTRDIATSLPPMLFSRTAASCNSDTFECGSCTDSAFQKKNPLCGWSKEEAKCFATGSSISNGVTLLMARDECPTLVLPSEDVVIGNMTFNATIGGNFSLKNKYHIIFMGDKKNYTCQTDVVDEKTLTVNCKELPDKEVKLTAVLYLSKNGRVFARSSNSMSIVKEGFPTLYIIFIAAGVLILIALLIVLIAFIVYKRRGVSNFKFEVYRKPDFSHFRWATDLWGNKNRAQRSQQDWDQLRELLQNPTVSSAISKATAATEADKYTSAMVYINATNGHATEFVLRLVQEEVQSIPNETQLFRGNSLASKAFRAYGRMVGLDYLWMTLARFVHELNHLVETSKAQSSAAKKNNVEMDALASDTTTTTTTTTSTMSEGSSILSTEFEVDPALLSSGSDEETNSYMLSQRARQLLVCILNSRPHMPTDLRYLIASLAHEAGQRFPGSERIAIGGTLFLRFLCPALIAPHCYALLMTPDRKKPLVPSEQLQRQLVLLGKVLQNLANGVLFGKKEPFMARMNQFISKNLDSVGKWMDELGSQNPSFHESATEVPQNTLQDSYQFILSHINTNLRKIQANLTQANAPPELYASLEAHAQAAQN